MYPMTNLSVRNSTNDTLEVGGFMFPARAGYDGSPAVTVTTVGHRVSEIAARETLEVTVVGTGEKL